MSYEMTTGVISSIFSELECGFKCFFNEKLKSNKRFAKHHADGTTLYEPHHEKTSFLHMLKQSRRSAAQYLRTCGFVFGRLCFGCTDN